MMQHGLAISAHVIATKTLAEKTLAIEALFAKVFYC